MLRFTGIQSYSYSYSYMEQRKVETDVDRMTGIELATLRLRRPRTNRLSYVCCYVIILLLIDICPRLNFFNVSISCTILISC